MSLGDPTQIGFEAGQAGPSALGQGIQQVAQMFAQKKQQQVQRDTALGLMKQFGLISPEGALDTEKAANLGAEYDPIGGTVKFAPKRAEKTFQETLAEAQAAQEAGYDYKGGKAQTKGSTGGYGAAQLRYAEQNAGILADAVEQGDYSAIAGLSKTAIAPIAVELRKRGHSVDEAMLGYKAQQSAMGNARVQEQKVESAVSAQALLDSSYDPKTGNYMVPPSQHVELALAGARMLSPTGVVSQEVIDQLRQGTIREAMSNILISAGFDPKQVGGSTQSVINMFAKLIEREGLASQNMLENLKTGKTTDFRKVLEESKAKKTGKSITDTTGLTKDKNKVGRFTVEIE